VKRRQISVGLLLAARLAAQQFPVAGTLINSESGVSVAHALMVIAPTAGGAEKTQVTAADGRFAFTLPAGRYHLTAQKNGIILAFGTDTPNSQIASSVIVAASQDTSQLQFRWFPPSAITGRIIDNAGEPAQNALIQLMRSEVRLGQRRMVTAAWTRADDRGEYRFGGLPAGSYYLAVTGQPWYAEDGTGMARPSLTYVTAYYPHASDPSGAAFLKLSSGVEARADMSLVTAPGVKLSISCSVCAGRRSTISLVQEGLDGLDSTLRSSTMVGNRLMLTGIPAGHYTARVAASDESGSPVLAQATVDATGNQTEVVLAPEHTAAVSGTLRLNAKAGKPQRPLSISLHLPDGRWSTGATATDGTFRLPVVTANKFRLALNSGYYVTEVIARGADYRDGFLTVPETGEVQLQVTAADDVGELKGFATWEGKPRMSALVVLTPASSTGDAPTYRAFQTESDGSYDLTNLRPGNYYLFAVLDTEFEYANPKAVGPYLAKARMVTIDPHAKLEENVAALSVAAQ
jgi:hypothetical protein